MLGKLGRALGGTRSERSWFAFCAAFALFAIWGHRYPAGIDLPQHANLFRLWTELWRGPIEYRELYRVELFTPYLLPYAVAYPLTLLFGALAATKLLLTFAALGTPLLMRRWLTTIGADPRLCLVGFIVAFDYVYVWGFISCTFALPLVFAYLSEFERQGDKPSLAAIGRTSLFGLMLFFSHGITFGVATGAAGLSYLFRGRWLKAWRALLHVVPLVAVAGLWLLLRRRQTGAHPIQDFVNFDRLITLFSGSYWPYPDKDFACVSLAGIAIFLVVARPRLGFSAARLAPALLSLVAFLALPEWIASTWLVGSRICVFVHAFVPALLKPREGDVVSRQWVHVFGALVLAFLTLLNVRLGRFNAELAGMDEIARFIPPGSDLQTLVPETSSSSEVFGDGQLGQVPAWITAERGGMIDNDSAAAIYFQIPIKRNAVPFPCCFRYVIAHGERLAHAAQLRRLTGSSKPIQRSGQWLLYERAFIETDDYEVLRSAQGWGQLTRDSSVLGRPLNIAGITYRSGLGAHAQSFARLRFKRSAARFKGACGLDSSAGSYGAVVFRIRDDQGKLLFDSGVRHGGAPAVPFSVPLEGRRELLLEARAPGPIDFGHADWVDLALE